ncbi:glycosyltransferase family 4 protein [Christiangramia flava]|uniref:Glycosyl transferase, group 1 n=1 Tax=Christiangramia flava JLT2011 TaxID=1229726 RepID=A0A1L7I7P5_9FLAO|nr:glycosyltransferase [Christiangramia flava]APU69132.1 Glycosyl transferase, group 1 [Christiangramia flava JLT2011]
MRFSVFTHAEHYFYEGLIYSYGPYVREMNYWISEFDEIHIIAPFTEKKPEKIDTAYHHSDIQFKNIPNLHYKENPFFQNLRKSFFVLQSCFRGMKNTDHIHLRCPGNVGMLALLVSSLFPKKPKTIKYAGNWDPESEQPLSYRFQKWWLSNTFLTRNAKVLVYGNWGNQSKNIIPFFTASFSESEKILEEKHFKPPFRFLFCGSLVEGKRPLLAAEIIHNLYKSGFEVSLGMYGDGPERIKITGYIENNDLEEVIKLHGNQSQETLIEAYKEAHFCILPSKSEGWPKALAEGMFFGCIPIGTEISCVPWMLGRGLRGILIPSTSYRSFYKEDIVLNTSNKISELLKDGKEMKLMSKKAQEWSQKYTLEKFRNEIHKLL